MATHDIGHQPGEALTGGVNLDAGTLGGIHLVDEGEIVGLGHDGREHAVELDARSQQVVPEVVEREAHVVAAGGKGVAELPVIPLQAQTLHEAPHDERRAPSMNGETEADALIGF